MSDRVRQAKEMWEDRWTARGYCLCVTGSVARAGQTDFSDLDLLVLQGSPDDDHENHTGKNVSDDQESFDARITAALSSGIEHVSVGVRSLDDVSAMIDTDIRSWVAQMDARYIAGHTVTYRAFREGMKVTVKKRREHILAGLELLTRERHRQYGSAVSLLEPNIKNSAGTLRDIHGIYYIGLLDVIASRPLGTEPLPDIREILSTMDLSQARRHALIDAYGFFLSVRAEMHRHSGHLHDSLDFELQRSVATSLGMRSHDEKKTVERFMRAYYAHARAVHVSVQLAFHDARQSSSSHGNRPHEPETDHALPLDEQDVMEVFLAMATGQRQPSAALIRAMDAFRGKTFRAETMRRFDDLLRTGTSIAATLMFMHEHGVLSAVLPEFAALEHFFQHNVYHFFTADEHTLRAIHATETRLRDDAAIARLLDQIPDKSVLYYAILLHDIAKPIDLAHHEQIGADLVPTILRRYGRHDIIDTVSFLVREHLRMEQLAFRRNFREITSLQPFLAVVQSVQRLDLLYLLTLADMAALNPGVLTDWKRELLRELHEVATRMLSTESTTDGASVSIRERADSSDTLFTTDGRDFSAAVQDVIDGELVRMDMRHHRAFSEVTIFCLDRPLLLSQFAAALFGADCSIVDASIETRHDVVIDTFRVVDIITDGHLREEQCSLLRNMIRAVCAGELEAGAIFDRYRRKWIRKLRKLPTTHIPTDVVYHPHHTASGAEQTIVDVYAPDTFGLLYVLSAELSLFGLNVAFAKIATRVDGVVDSFYVVDESGGAFTDSTRREQLRLRLLEKIQALAE
ncbi:MAG: HD domain-containing protein [Bacteroidota bacterium]|jgi:[protein-PII] uridylyltransferase|nr:HD domain-containing protein [Bacteroidota bacterium]